MNPGRRPLIAGNWKMYKGGAHGITLAHSIAEGVRDIAGVDVVVAPPFTALAAVAHEVNDVAGDRVGVAAQNMYPKAEGAFTGEISAPMLLESGCTWVILGHSERRQLFGETDTGVRDKAVAALEAGLRPIVCVGETLEEREAGRTLEVVFRQIDAVAATLAKSPDLAVIAYEPVWAIGTGKVAGPDQAEEAHAAIRERLRSVSQALSDKAPILYGGSVKPDNAAMLLACPNVDGALVGGASLEAGSFLQIVRAAAGK
ncbi:MAG TPA: triose-phosphate isomerase [Polyangiaceae bacterium]|jgi:triosephosphate isomerase|nr:triose-phosphate isomerase [Polyangiaceae bacterium]